MRRTALVLVASLAAGTSAGLVAHGRSTADAATAPRFAQPRTIEEPRALAPLPQRAAVPRKASVAPATIEVPRLRVRSRIFASSQLDDGPAWWKITGRPGGGDTIAVAGHRTTHTRPFYYLERLRRGDSIFLAYEGRTHRYRVVKTRVFPGDDLHIADAVGHERLLLTTCTPRGSARSRLVVEALPG